MIDGTPSGIFSNTTGVVAGAGAGGNIALRGDQVSLSNRATITANSTGPGNAGNILTQASDSFISRNSTVTTSTMQSDGGNITIIAGNLVQLDHSEITTSVQGGAGTGGNITIDPPVVLLNSSKIVASAVGGSGGNINIVASFFLMSPDSVIDASSTFGVSGTISIESPLSNLSESLAPLPQNFLQAGALLASRCAARVAGNTSSFVVAGRDGLPMEPGAMLPSPLLSANASSSSGIGLALDLPTLVTSRLTSNLSYDFVTPDRGCSS